MFAWTATINRAITCSNLSLRSFLVPLALSPRCFNSRFSSDRVKEAT